MHIITLPWGKRIDLNEGSDLKEASKIFSAGEYGLSIGPLTEIKDPSFFDRFLIHFKEISHFNFMAWGNGVSYEFLYQMPNLKRLHIDVLYPIDFERLPNINELSLMWNKKLIFNFEKLEKIEYLSISAFDEKDLSRLNSFSSLKSLSLKTATVKSLKGIEKLTNLRVLSLGGVRSLMNISDIIALQRLNFLEFDICWKLQDFSPIGQLKELEVLQLMDCKNLASIKFVREMPNLKQLYSLGTTVINDYDTSPAEHVPVYFGSRASKRYNNAYPEKEIKEGQKTAISYL